MKSLINKILSVELVLIVASTILNILFCMDKISRRPVEIGFILVILTSCVMNYFLMKAKNKGEEVNEKRRPLQIAMFVVIGVAWVVSYGFTV